MDLLWSSSCVYYLVIRSSTEPTLFHVGCRPSHQVGLRPALTFDLLVRKVLALIFDHIGPNPIVTSEWTALTSDLLVRKACTHI